LANISVGRIDVARLKDALMIDAGAYTERFINAYQCSQQKRINKKG